MTEEQKQNYISERVNNQIKWFDPKSGFNKKWHNWLVGISTIGAILSASSILCQIESCAAIISLLVAVSIAIDNLFHFREKWLTYRMANEQLKSLLNRYQALDSITWNDFVESVESVISQTNDNWQQLIVKTNRPNQI